MITSPGQMNPFVRTLLHVGWVALAGAIVFALIGYLELQQNLEFGEHDGFVQLAISGWLLNVGIAALLLWLVAAAVVWQPKARRPAGPTAQSGKSHWE